VGGRRVGRLCVRRHIRRCAASRRRGSTEALARARVLIVAGGGAGLDTPIRQPLGTLHPG